MLMHSNVRSEDRSSALKMLWMLATSFCFVLMGSLIAENVIDYWTNEGSTKVAHHYGNTSLRFPKVTFCSMNPLSKAKLNAFSTTWKVPAALSEYLMLANEDPKELLAQELDGELTKLDESFHRFLNESGKESYDFFSFFSNVSFDCEEMFIKCFFGGKRIECCSPEYFHAHLTEMGMCFSIASTSFHQHAEKENSGLQVIVRIADLVATHTFNKTDSAFDDALDTGFRIFIEEEQTHTYKSSHGMFVAARQALYSGITLNKYKLSANCRDSWKDLSFAGSHSDRKYKARACLSKCTAKKYVDFCRCAPLLFDIDAEYKTCTPKRAASCYRSQSLKDDLAECSNLCLPECDRWDYQPSNSYGMLLPSTRSKYGNEECSSASIYFRELSWIDYEAVPKESVFDLLSTIGGTSGLCLGISLLTLIEILIGVGKTLLACCFCLSGINDRKEEKARKERRDREEDARIAEEIRSAYRKERCPSDEK